MASNDGFRLNINWDHSAQYFLITLFIIGLIIRLMALNSIPNGLFRDEAAKGLIAYNILETGKDLDGTPFPLFTRELSTYNTAIYSYLCIPFISLLGLNEVAVRLPAAIAGSLTILALYWALLPFIKRKYALAAAFFLTFLPWHIVFSRWANQGIMVPLFLCLSTGFMGRSLLRDSENPNQQKTILGKPYAGILLGFIFLGLSLYIYDINKVFVPLFILTILISHRKEVMRNPKHWVVSIAVFILISLPIAVYTVINSSQSQSRFNRISLLEQGYGLLKTILVFISNWLTHFSPAYLFISGDANPRHGLPLTGILLLATAPFLIMGLIQLMKIRKTPWGQLIIGWLIIYPIAASLTIEGIPHALRTITGIPVICIICALGVEYFCAGYQKTLKPIRNLFSVIMIITLVFNITLIISGLFFIYPIQSAPYFQYGMKEAVESVNQIESHYDLIMVSPSLGWPDIYFHFYSPRKDKSISSSKIHFFHDSEELTQSLIQLKPGEKALLVLSDYEIKELIPLKTINYPDGTAAIKLITYPQ